LLRKLLDGKFGKMSLDDALGYLKASEVSQAKSQMRVMVSQEESGFEWRSRQNRNAKL
jgi:hypothetical protein